MMMYFASFYNLVTRNGTSPIYVSYALLHSSFGHLSLCWHILKLPFGYRTGFEILHHATEIHGGDIRSLRRRLLLTSYFKFLGTDSFDVILSHVPTSQKKPKIRREVLISFVHLSRSTEWRSRLWNRRKPSGSNP